MIKILREDKSCARPDPKIEDNQKKGVYEHQRIVDQFLGVISLCPMDDELKMVLRLRVWGRNPSVFCPMTYLDIATELKCKVKQVEEWERDALYNVGLFLKRTSAMDAINKSVRDKTMVKIVNPEKRIII